MGPRQSKCQYMSGANPSQGLVKPASAIFPMIASPATRGARSDTNYFFYTSQTIQGA
uniref:Uncharacterized protein n=1 Tax=Hyaloperonospora arabidopsidis (strain Emoy2) TaxID=559515 RepID=M4BXG9_HYAAE